MPSQLLGPSAIVNDHAEPRASNIMQATIPVLLKVNCALSAGRYWKRAVSWKIVNRNQNVQKYSNDDPYLKRGEGM
jgi:hypothetical protein